jgi:hypothetical protein
MIPNAIVAMAAFSFGIADGTELWILVIFLSSEMQLRRIQTGCQGGAKVDHCGVIRRDFHHGLLGEPNRPFHK